LEVKEITLREAIPKLLEPLNCIYLVDGPRLRVLTEQEFSTSIVTRLYGLPKVGEAQLPLKDPARTVGDALSKVPSPQPAIIESIDGCLVVTATYQQHQKVDRLFELLEDAVNR